jgi:A/G-specific adenine glycosylase
VSEPCAARARNEQERFPVRGERIGRPTRRGVAYVAVRRDGAVLLRLRPKRGLLGGMAEVPSHGWDVKSAAAADNPPPLAAVWAAVPGAVVHVFTHFRLELSVQRAFMPERTSAPAGHWWSLAEDLPGEALPSLMRKVIEAAVPGATKPAAKPPWRARA